jgi:hypothetical protein
MADLHRPKKHPGIKVGLKTRRNVSEFLMDLGHAPSILNVRKELNSVFEDGYKNP